MKQKVRIEDVAREAGVSKTTVSRAINNAARISVETREHVLKIAKKLNFEPNNIARSLSTGRTMMVGVLLEDILNNFYTEVAKGIETELKKAGYTMLLTSSDFDLEEEYRLTRLLVQNKVDGILITPIREDSKAMELLKSGSIPFFMMNNKSENPDVNWVDTKNIEGGYIGAKYLADLGHKRIMYMGTTKIRGAEERLEGFIKAMQEKGVPRDKKLIVENILSRKEGYTFMNRFLQKEGKSSLPTAIMTVNDDVAIGVMQSLIEHNIDIPEDVSLLGFDDIHIANLIRVPLTTVHQPKFAMGEIASRNLIKIMDGGKSVKSEHYLLNPHLVIRKSCKELN
jgi:LacI family transcriptional regulator